MRHFWCGILTLILLLGICLLITGEIVRIHRPVAGFLEQAAIAGAKEEWPAARELVSKADKLWRYGHAFTAAVADHTPMDEIDSLFRRLPVLAAAEETVEFTAACRALAQKTEAMVQAHSWAWENLL